MWFDGLDWLRQLGSAGSTSTQDQLWLSNGLNIVSPNEFPHPTRLSGFEACTKWVQRRETLKVGGAGNCLRTKGYDPIEQLLMGILFL